MLAGVSPVAANHPRPTDHQGMDFMRTPVVRLLLLGATALAAACSDSDTQPSTAPTDPAFAQARPAALTGTPAERAAQIAQGVNARLAAKGSRLRLTDAHFFTVGKGVPPFRSHNFDARWPKRDLTYYIDASDFTADAPAGPVDAALVAGYETWDAVRNITLSLTRVPDNQSNPDLLDAINLNPDGTCTLFDGIIDTDWQGPYADIVLGGWLAEDYFSKCLGSGDIIAVTWTFSDPADLNHDKFNDIQYVEQYFNDAWGYVTTGSQYLDFDGPFDVQSIAVHEDGHALGLDHTGGPNANQPFKLHPNGRVFSPEAVMNPFDLGGEKRDLFPLDLASIRQLYSRVK
jgi:hypothetical protein